jgi:16S rRNA (uracil1498-N3)-methyltransferase
MPGYDFRSPRLYVVSALETGTEVALVSAQAHYLTNVLRLKSGSSVLVFNGRDGEWSATLTLLRRGAVAEVGARTRSQTTSADLHYLFAPLKAARLDYMVQKAVEMGVSRLQPMLTRYTQVARVNTERMRANAVEAAEQCGILSLPVFCDEAAAVTDPVAALAGLTPAPLAVLIGPEGGFAEDERAALLKLPNVVQLSLGPRILRADTAAVAALTLVQALVGDWRRGETAPVSG